MIHPLWTNLWTDLFVLHQPVLEKILRPALMYVILIALVRVFGKRELAQLNPFDLIVLLTLSNTVQNAIIGDDNTLLGGAIGALALLTVNWLLSKALFKLPRVNSALEGPATTLITGGVVDARAMKRETLTQEELISVLNKNGFNDPAEIDTCTLEPNGTFFVKGASPSASDRQMTEVSQALRVLTEEVQALRAELRGEQRSNLSPELGGELRRPL